ncbi:MAG: GyrI-like domain-containing protein [bacterium]|nr:GyrI-like domain-containing protein [bacterium]
MPPVEAIWKNLRKKPELREWKAFLLQPVTVTSALLYEVTDIATMRHPDTPLPEVKLETCSEGACLQTLHRGPYALLDTAETAIHSYAKEWGLKIEKTRHEIYLNDPRKTKEADLETIIRMQVATK